MTRRTLTFEGIHPCIVAALSIQRKPRSREGMRHKSVCAARYTAAVEKGASRRARPPVWRKLNGKQTPSLTSERRNVLPPQRCARCVASAAPCQPETGLNRPCNRRSACDHARTARMRLKTHHSRTCGDARQQGTIMPLPFMRRTLAAAFCFSPALVFAQAAVPELDNIVVTANRQPQALADTTGDITVVSREELQRSGADSMSSVLARQPGIQITDNG